MSVKHLFISRSHDIELNMERMIHNQSIHFLAKEHLAQTAHLCPNQIRVAVLFLAWRQLHNRPRCTPTLLEQIQCYSPGLQQPGYLSGTSQNPQLSTQCSQLVLYRSKCAVQPARQPHSFNTGEAIPTQQVHMVQLPPPHEKHIYFWIVPNYQCSSTCSCIL